MSRAKKVIEETVLESSELDDFIENLAKGDYGVGTKPGEIVTNTRKFKLIKLHIEKGDNKGKFMYLAAISVGKDKVDISKFTISDKPGLTLVRPDALSDGTILTDIPDLAPISTTSKSSNLAVNKLVNKMLAFSFDEEDEVGSEAGKALSKKEKDEIKRLRKEIGLGKGVDPYFVPKTAGSKFTKLVEKILENIFTRQQNRKAGDDVKQLMMLAGSPGSGKTSLITCLGQILGVPVIVVEAPHIIKEHLIQIPYIINGVDGTKQSKIAFAQAVLGKVINSKRQAPVQMWEKSYSKDPQLKAIVDKWKTVILQLRETYQCILFLDEFYRTGDVRIQNLMRGIINGKIGDTTIDPRRVYTIYASNLGTEQEGIDKILEHNEFTQVNLDSMDKVDFFQFMKVKYLEKPSLAKKSFAEGGTLTESEEEDRVRPIISPEVFSAFRDAVTNDDLGHDDLTSEVRLSPRRMEQIMAYVSVNIDRMKTMGGKEQKETARALMSFIKTNLSNYLKDSEGDDKYSKLLSKYSDIISKIIKDTTGVTVSLRDSLDPVEWKIEVDNQIDTKLLLGSSRKNVPVVSGPPGIAKTTYMRKYAAARGMACIHIECTTLNPDSVIGIAQADPIRNEVKFTAPELYRKIMDERNRLEKEHAEAGRPLKPQGPNGYRFILFFDELNRVEDIKVFNGLRKLILEKEFSATEDSYEPVIDPDTNEPQIMKGYLGAPLRDLQGSPLIQKEFTSKPIKLPKDMLVVAAINPHDVEGATIEFTSHMRDVLDIITSRATWDELLYHINNSRSTINLNEALGFDIVGTMLTAYKLVVASNQIGSTIDNYGNKLGASQKPFYINLGGDTIGYMSPRAIHSMVNEASTRVQINLINFEHFNPDKRYTEDEYDNFKDIMKDKFIDQFEDNLNHIQTVRGIFDSSLTKKLAPVIRSEVDSLDIWNAISKKQQENVMTSAEASERAKSKWI